MRSNHIFHFTFVLVSFFFLFVSPTDAAIRKIPGKQAAAKETGEQANPSDVINDFCSQRITKEDRSFCILVFDPNPQTRAIKDNLGLLKVGVQFAIGNAMKTQEFLSFLSEDKTIKLPLKSVLEQCITSYNGFIKELKIIIGDLEDDPPMASYDARMASEALSHCHNSLTASKIYDDSILGRTEIASQYSKLIEEISRSV